MRCALSLLKPTMPTWRCPSFSSRAHAVLVPLSPRVFSLLSPCAFTATTTVHLPVLLHSPITMRLPPQTPSPHDLSLHDSHCRMPHHRATHTVARPS
ncbi:hypothetical protein AMTR_s00004p00260960 [Amborella trichopoda]|uniref:Uncharacterized protein n=1 Tax=Amborella trichopoda TaxID=13333 RepID=W1NEE8_AMBTC|nr:hypothetical protein AMTR_s00004p00260960 [Amborella trichopoda]